MILKRVLALICICATLVSVCGCALSGNEKPSEPSDVVQVAE